MPYWTFTVTLRGEGETPEEAWFDATDAFADDPGDPPTDGELEEDDE